MCLSFYHFITLMTFYGVLFRNWNLNHDSIINAFKRLFERKTKKFSIKISCLLDFLHLAAPSADGKASKSASPPLEIFPHYTSLSFTFSGEVSDYYGTLFTSLPSSSFLHAVSWEKPNLSYCKNENTSESWKQKITFVAHWRQIGPLKIDLSMMVACWIEVSWWIRTFLRKKIEESWIVCEILQREGQWRSDDFKRIWIWS